MRLTLALLKRVSRGPQPPPPFELGELTKKYANLPEKYLQRHMKTVISRTPRGINYLPKEDVKEKTYIGVARPWSIESTEECQGMEIADTPFVEPLRDWFFFKGDRVQVLVGKDKGKQGIVDLLIQERNWIIVRGLNGDVVPKKETDGRIYAYSYVERPLLVPHQVALVDPGDLLPTEVEWAYTEEGEKVRISKRSGRILPMSRRNEETYQYKSKATYAESTKDTINDNMESTFKPKLMTFEMEIAEELGIKEDRVPRKTYWY